MMRPPHAALGSVHRFGDAEPKPDQVPAIGNGARPVEHRLIARLDRRERVGNDMRRRKCDPVEGSRRLRDRQRLAGQAISRQGAIGRWQA
jgi:hypothetical protein